MKKTALLIFIFSFFFYTEGYSQRDRRIGAESRYNTPKKKKEKVQDPAEMWADYMKKELKLDDLQYAVFKISYSEHKNEIEQLVKSDIHPQQLKDQLKAITEQINVKVKKVLSDDQKVKYQNLVDEQEKKFLKS